MIEAADSSLPLAMVASVILTAVVTAASITDLRRRIIPDLLTGPAAVTGLLFAAVAGGGSGMLLAGGSGLAVSMPLYLANRIRPAGMGMGDVKLAAVIGIWLGVSAWGVLLVGLALAALTGMMISLGQRRSPARTTLPLAPFLAAGTLPVLASALVALA